MPAILVQKGNACNACNVRSVRDHICLQSYLTGTQYACNGTKIFQMAFQPSTITLKVFVNFQTLQAYQVPIRYDCRHIWSLTLRTLIRLYWHISPNQRFCCYNLYHIRSGFLIFPIHLIILGFKTMFFIISIAFKCHQENQSMKSCENSIFNNRLLLSWRYSKRFFR